MTISSRVALLGWKGEAPTFAASSENPSFPVSNLTNQRLSLPWCSIQGDVDGVTLDLSYNATAARRGCALVGTNLTDAAQVEVDFGTTLGAADLGTSGLVNAFNVSLSTIRQYVPPWGRHVITLQPAWSPQYVRYTFHDPYNPDGFLKVAFAFAEDLWQPGINFEAGSWKKSDEVQGSPGAQVLIRSQAINLWRLVRSEENEIMNLARVILQNQRVLLVPQPSSPETWFSDSLWCTLKSMPTSVPLNTSGKFRVVSMEFSEVDE